MSVFREPLSFRGENYLKIFSDTRVPMLIIEPGTGVIVNANGAASEFYGYEPETLKSLNINDINQLKPEEVQTEIDKARQSKQSYFKFPHKLANGEIRTVEVYSCPVVIDNHTLLFSIVHDITAREIAEKKIVTYAQIFNSTSDGILLADSDGNILDTNAAFNALRGLAKGASIGKACESILSTAPGFLSITDVMQDECGCPWRGEMILNTCSERRVPVEVAISRVKGTPGNAQHFILIVRDISYYKATSEKLSFLAHHDALTRTPNRVLLMEKLDQHLCRAARTRGSVYVVFIDLDSFKSINDSFGHSRGDDLLKSVASRLQSVIRHSDTISRVSGDEFVAIVEGENNAEEIVQTMNRIVAAFNVPFLLGDQALHVTASMGISKYPGDSADPVELINFADTAMYEAKKKGRNQYCLFNEENQQALDRRITVEAALRGALQRHEFEMHYQPQISLKTDECTGAEALIRWKHAELGFVSPATFIPLAEKLGIMGDIGRWVVENVCAQAALWQEKGIRFGKVAINISGTQLKNVHFYKELQSVLNQTGLLPDKLELEVTEDVMISSLNECIHQLRKVRALGVDISVDDFGTGYSSLSCLKKLPVNKLKIDRSFMAEISSKEDDEAITQSIIALGKAMKLDVIAEGIENHAQADYLLFNGCYRAQGYLYGKPMPPDEFENWLILRNR